MLIYPMIRVYCGGDSGGLHVCNKDRPHGLKFQAKTHNSVMETVYPVGVIIGDDGGCEKDKRERKTNIVNSAIGVHFGLNAYC